MTESDLGWLAGIIDGEGTITLCEVHKYDREKIGYSVNVCVSSTDTKIAYHTMDLMKEMNIQPAIQILKRDIASNHKDAYQVRITNYFEIEIYLRMIQKYLVGKQEQAYWMLEYIKQRELEGKNQPIGDLSRTIANKIRSLNTKGKVVTGKDVK